MSSFNVNGPNMNNSMLQGSQNLGKDGGGGGNTGYMNMRKKKKNKGTEDDNSVFLEEGGDVLEESNAEYKEGKKGKILGAISKFIHDDKAVPKSKSKDYFTKPEPDSEYQEPDSDEDLNDYDEFEEYDIETDETLEPIEDEEYEVAEDDDYYGGIDV